MVSSTSIKRIKYGLLSTGICLLVLSLGAVILLLLGVIDAPNEILAGESTIHSVARFSIIGCLLAAVGSLE